MSDNWIHEWNQPNAGAEPWRPTDRSGRDPARAESVDSDSGRLFPDSLIAKIKTDERIPKDCIGVVQGHEIQLMRLDLENETAHPAGKLPMLCPRCDEELVPRKCKSICMRCGYFDDCGIGPA